MGVKDSLGEEFYKEILFPFEKIRESQAKLITDVKENLQKRKNMVLHAPTGLGKTVSVLGPCLKYAIDNNLTIFFLTSRHTQHEIVIDTLKDIKKKYDINVVATDIIGKKWMCAVPGVTAMASNEFSEYCKSVREEGKCEFYLKTKKSGNKLTMEAEKLLDDLEKYNPTHVERMTKLCSDNDACPYELATALASRSRVIIADYNYVFNPDIREAFFGRAKKALADSIIIIDEAHNIPNRMKEQLTAKISSSIIRMAIKEAEKYDFKETAELLRHTDLCLEQLTEEMNVVAGSPERIVDRSELIEAFEKRSLDYRKVIENLEFVGSSIREEQKKSFVGSVASFLKSWEGPDEAYARILNIKDFKGRRFVTLSYRCLDPSIATKPVIDESHCTIAMSGTLSPTSMYRDLMGFDEEKSFEEEYESPFPRENRLNLIVPLTTTKFTQRHDKQFDDIGRITAEMTNSVPGNSIVFFPSYEIRDRCMDSFFAHSRRTNLTEEPKLTSEEKAELLKKFKFYKDTGAVMLGVIGGSFSEGIDLPGDNLISSVIVGIPLHKPDLETRETTKYYDEKFGPGRGMHYGYFFPAINKAIQAGGRPFRSAEDKGMNILLDERYALPFYLQYLPKSWNVKISKSYREVIEEFFDPKQKKLNFDDFEEDDARNQQS